MKLYIVPFGGRSSQRIRSPLTNFYFIFFAEILTQSFQFSGNGYLVACYAQHRKI